MANRVKMAMIHSIQALHALHWSQRRIARELGIDAGDGPEVPLGRIAGGKTRHSARRV